MSGKDVDFDVIATKSGAIATPDATGEPDAVPDATDVTSAIDATDAEVIGIESGAIWVPRVSDAVKAAERTGDMLPVYGAVAAKLEGDGIEATNAMVVAEAERVMTEVSISQCLKDEMVAPNAVMTIGDDIVTNARAIGKVLVKKALDGDMSAIREVLNRTEGKVPNVTHSSSASVRVNGDANSIASLMDKIDKNKR